jgi:peptidoglycan hydrolase-like protein with peptidoglycan-binding domain
MNAEEVAEWLKQFKAVSLNKIDASVNTYLMMALYQRALQFLGYPRIKVDGFFWGQNGRTLYLIQPSLWVNPDGEPGPNTTRAIIVKLTHKKAKEGIAEKSTINLKELESKIARKLEAEKRENAGEGKLSEREIAALKNLPAIKNTPPQETIPSKTAPEAIPQKAIDMSAEYGNIQRIAKNARKNSPIQVLQPVGTIFSWESLVKIDYAIVRQTSDRDSYVFDKPENGIRTVYRLDEKNTILAIVKVSQDWKSNSLIWWTQFTAPYMPTFIHPKR